MPPKMLTSTALTRGLAEQDAESFEHLVLVGAAADVEEVGRLAAVVLDQVHRAHRQAGAVDQAGDVAVEADVAQAALRGPRASAGSSSASSSIATISGWRNAALSSKFSLQSRARTSPLGRDDQRVDLGERGVLVDEQLDEVLEERRALLGRVAGQSQRLADLAGLEIGQAESDVDRLAVDLLGGLVGDGLDLDAALGRGHQDRALQAAVDGQPQVELADDVVADGHQHLGDELALGTGLVGDQRLAEQAGGGVARRPWPTGRAARPWPSTRAGACARWRSRAPGRGRPRGRSRPPCRGRRRGPGP